MKTRTFTLPNSDDKKLQEIAESEKRSVSNLLSIIVSEFILSYNKDNEVKQNEQ